MIETSPVRHRSYDRSIMNKHQMGNIVRTHVAEDHFVIEHGVGLMKDRMVRLKEKSGSGEYGVDIFDLAVSGGRLPSVDLNGTPIVEAGQYLPRSVLARLRQEFQSGLLAASVGIQGLVDDEVTTVLSQFPGGSGTFRCSTLQLIEQCRFPDHDLDGRPLSALSGLPLSSGVKSVLFARFGTRFMSTLQIEKSSRKDPLVHLSLWCERILIDPYVLLLNDWRLPSQDAKGKDLEMFARARLEPDQIATIQRRWQSSISTLSDYFHFKKTKYSRLLRMHKEFIARLHKLDTDAMVRYVNGSFSGMSFQGSSACFPNPFLAVPGEAVMMKDMSRPLTTGAPDDRWGVRNIDAMKMSDMKLLISVIHKAPQPLRRLTLFRGMTLEPPTDGKFLFHPSILSTSLLEVMALRFIGNSEHASLLVIEVDTRTVPVLAIYNSFVEVTYISNEFEVLLPPVVLKVKRVQENVDVFRTLTQTDRRALGMVVGPEQIRPIRVVHVEAAPPYGIDLDARCVRLSLSPG